MGLLEGRDLRFVLEREGDVVEAVQPGVAPRLIDLERYRKALGIGDAESVQVDGELIAAVFRTLEELLDLVFAEADGQHAVFEAVVVEDVGEGGGDDGAEAVVFDGPDGMFATGAAAEVAAGEKDRGSLGFGLIQLEVRVRRLAIVAISPIEKQKR